MAPLSTSLGAFALVVALGVGLAAVQLLPLYELSTFSFRGRGVTYEFATSFAPPPQNLLTLVFPYFFREHGSGAYWSPWFRWDTTAYAGIAPLLLAVLAVVLALAQTASRTIPAAFERLALRLSSGAVRRRGAPMGLYKTVCYGWSLVAALMQIDKLIGYGGERGAKAPTTNRGAPSFVVGALAPVPRQDSAIDQVVHLDQGGPRPKTPGPPFRAAAEPCLPDQLVEVHQGGSSGRLPAQRVFAAVEPIVPVRWVVFFGGVFVVSLLLALGDYAPVKIYALLWQLPVFSSTRVPGRYLFLALFALAMLAGFGFQGLTRLLANRTAGDDAAVGGERARLLTLFRRLLIVLTVLGLAAMATFWLVREWAVADPAAARALLAPYLELRGRNVELPSARDPVGAFLTALDPMSRWTSRSFLWLELSVLLLWGWYLIRRPGAAFRVGLVLLTAADLLLFARDFHPRIPIAQTANDGPAVQFLVEHNGLHRVASMWPVLETWPNKLLPRKVAEATGYSSLLPDRHTAYMGEAYRLDNRLLDVMGVKYLVAHRARIPARLQSEQPVFEDAEVAVYERSTALPRALVVGSAALAGSPAEALRRMTRSDFDPLRQLVVEDPAALVWAGDPTTPAPPGRAEIVSYGADRVQARVFADQPSFFFLTDTYYPGWRALVDGVERPIYRADYLFRAVPVSPGEHTVEFVFDPITVKAGAAATLLSLLAVGLGLLSTVPGVRRWAWRRSSAY